ncbi:uncharacterized protein PAC_11332 [Phialocephala subalpina]|uniref:Uncharacterized protein n=1 Tax=Phialocephala subalpina TaxID=576137 RepID=A0A1L7X8W9_9HELO|nr:uncharacterized protein PAC_11332 [Phialocephala subalpina]
MADSGYTSSEGEESLRTPMPRTPTVELPPSYFNLGNPEVALGNPNVPIEDEDLDGPTSSHVEFASPQTPSANDAGSRISNVPTEREHSNSVTSSPNSPHSRRPLIHLNPPTLDELLRDLKLFSESGCPFDESLRSLIIRINLYHLNVPKRKGHGTETRLYNHPPTWGHPNPHISDPHLELGGTYSLAMYTPRLDSVNVKPLNVQHQAQTLQKVTLNTASGDKQQKALPIGRLLYQNLPTHWVVFLSMGSLWALRADPDDHRFFCLYGVMNQDALHDRHNGLSCAWISNPIKASFEDVHQVQAILLGDVDRDDLNSLGRRPESFKCISLPRVASWETSSWEEGDGANNGIAEESWTPEALGGDSDEVLYEE